ncbi:MAG: BON domain-containing protein [Rubrivivax sp.]|nr:BON domain-containing protein [Rubrivivax sp.]
MNTKLQRSTILMSLLASAALLAACDRNEQARVEQTGATTATSAERAGAAVKEAGRDASQAVGNAADAVANKSGDVAITTAVNARLAADERLSALKINVDTVGGKVVLRGTAPDTASRTRATELARAVDGVSDVTNELSVQPSR